MTHIKFIGAFLILGIFVWLATGNRPVVSVKPEVMPTVSTSIYEKCGEVRTKIDDMEKNLSKEVDATNILQSDRLKASLRSQEISGYLTSSQKVILYRYLDFSTKKYLEEKSDSNGKQLLQHFTDHDEVVAIVNTLIKNQELAPYLDKEVQILGTKILNSSKLISKIRAENPQCFRYSNEIEKLTDEAIKKANLRNLGNNWIARKSGLDLVDTLRD